jgi:hypothetical protein
MRDDGALSMDPIPQTTAPRAPSSSACVMARVCSDEPGA